MKLDPRLQRLIDWLHAHRTWLSALLTVAVLGVAGLALWEILKEVKLADIGAAFGRITPHQVALSIGLTALSFFVLSFYDVLGLNAIGKPQPYWRALLGSFTAYNLSHNLGFAPITGAAARWRAYRGTNLDPGDIARLVVIADRHDQEDVGNEHRGRRQQANRVEAIVAILEDFPKRSAAHWSPVTSRRNMLQCRRF